MKYILSLFLISSIAYGRTVHLGGANTVLYNTEIDGQSVDNEIAAIIGKRFMLDPKEPLYVVIVSLGGRVDKAYLFLDVLKTIPNVEVICKDCESAAGFIFVEFPGKRLALKNSEFMEHYIFIDHVTAPQLQNGTLNHLIQNSDVYNTTIANKLHMSKKDYENKIKDTEWRVSGKQLVEIHAADELVTADCDDYIKELAPHTCAGD